MTANYDVIIIGAGIAGCALAHSLSTSRPKESPPLKIALIERSLAEPDRIVGELLQPGGMRALKELGLTWCTESIDAIPVRGYCVVYDGKQVEIPYPAGEEGRSFHHGKFIMRLRQAAHEAVGVDVIEGAANELIECPLTGRVIGVSVTRKVSPLDGAGSSSSTYSQSFFADITIAADGCYSKFRASLGSGARVPVTKSHFVGAILHDAPLPLKYHGTVALVPGSGPVLMYQIGEHDTRMLVDMKTPLPRDQKEWIRTMVVPGLPSALRQCVLASVEKDRLRSMPNSFLPPTMQGQSGCKEGIILIGDSWNMRHPLTGGGMTVALSDVVLLSQFLTKILSPSHQHNEDVRVHGDGLDLDWERITEALESWHWSRKGLSSTVNILSVALYDLFGADDENLSLLREGCFRYFERGGDCIDGPVSLLSGLAPSPMLLLRHFTAVAFYSIYILFTTPRPKGPVVPNHSKASLKTEMVVPGWDEYPYLCWRSLMAIWTACVVFAPLLWSEVRWW